MEFKDPCLVQSQLCCSDGLVRYAGQNWTVKTPSFWLDQPLTITFVLLGLGLPNSYMHLCMVKRIPKPSHYSVNWRSHLLCPHASYRMISKFPVFTVKKEHAHTLSLGGGGPGDELGYELVISYDMSWSCLPVVQKGCLFTRSMLPVIGSVTWLWYNICLERQLMTITIRKEWLRRCCHISSL